MAMGLVSDEEFEKAQDNLIPSPNDVTIKELERPGRQDGDNNVPDSLRKIIGETSETEGRASALELAQQFGISPSSVSAYANGSRSTATYDKQPLLQHINGAKERVSKRAMSRLFKALNAITPEKLQDANVRDLSGVARDMSAIIKDMEPETPKTPAGDSNQPQYVIYAPQFRDERSYEIVHAKE